MKEDHEGHNILCLREYPGWVLLSGSLPCCVAIIIENALLLATICRAANTSFGAVSYIFLASLALVDIWVGLATMVSIVCYVLLLPKTGVEYEPLLSLSVLGTVTYSLVLLSMFHLAMIALDRYVFIVHPFFYLRRVTPTSVKYALAACWLLTFLNTIIFNIPKIVAGGFATCDIRHNFDLAFSSLLALYVLAMIVSFIAYIQIYKVVCHQKRSISAIPAQTQSIYTAASKAHPGSSSRAADNTSSPGIQTNPGTVSSSALKTIKFLFLVFGLFVVCTLPVVITSIASIFYPIPQGVVFAAVALQTSNSAMNFIALIGRDKTFRKEFLRMLCDIRTWISESQSV